MPLLSGVMMLPFSLRRRCWCWSAFIIVVDRGARAQADDERRLSQTLHAKRLRMPSLIMEKIFSFILRILIRFAFIWWSLLHDANSRTLAARRRSFSHLLPPVTTIHYFLLMLYFGRLAWHSLREIITDFPRQMFRAVDTMRISLKPGRYSLLLLHKSQDVSYDYIRARYAATILYMRSQSTAPPAAPARRVNACRR